LLENNLAELSNSSALSFPLTLKNGKSVVTVGEAMAYFSALTEQQRDKSYWKLSISTLTFALKNPRHLEMATRHLQSALAIEGDLAPAVT
jgi:hypothetical protein